MHSKDYAHRRDKRISVMSHQYLDNFDLLENGYIGGKNDNANSDVCIITICK